LTKDIFHAKLLIISSSGGDSEISLKHIQHSKVADMDHTYFLDSFEKVYADLWEEDIKDILPDGAELKSIKISGDSELIFLSHIELETSDGNSESSDLGCPEISGIEIMESVDEELPELIEKLEQSMAKRNSEANPDYIPEEFTDIYRCCVNHIMLNALDLLIKKLPSLSINIPDSFQYGLCHHDDIDLTTHIDNDSSIQKYLSDYSFNSDEIKCIADFLFKEKKNQAWFLLFLP